MTIPSNALSNEDVTLIGKELSQGGLKPYTLGYIPIYGELKPRWSSTADPQANLQTILKAMRVIAEWQEAGNDHQIDLESLSLTLLATGDVVNFESDNQKSTVSEVHKKLVNKNANNENWRHPHDLINDICLVAKKILLTHLESQSIESDNSIELIDFESHDTILSNADALYQSELSKSEISTDEDGHLSVIREPSLVWKLATAPISLFWSEGKAEKIQEMQKVQLVVLSTLKSVQSMLSEISSTPPILAVQGGTMPIESLAVRVLTNPLFKKNEGDETLIKLNQEITSTAKSILLDTLPISIEMGTGMFVKEDKGVWLQSVKFIQYW